MRTLRAPQCDGPGAGHLNRSACGVVQIGMTKKIAERSRRAPGGGRRTCRLAVRYTPAEMARVEAAAAREGLVTAAWLGNAGLELSDPDPQGRAAGHASREELDRLTQATEKVRRAGYLLNQVVRTMHATGQVSVAIEYVAAKVWEKVTELDDAAVAVAAPLLRAQGRDE